MSKMTCQMNTRVYHATKAIELTEERIEQLENELKQNEDRLADQQVCLRNLYIEGHGFEYMQPLIVRQEVIDLNRNRSHMLHWQLNDIVFLKSINVDGLGRVEGSMYYMKDIPLEVLELMRLNLEQDRITGND